MKTPSSPSLAARALLAVALLAGFYLLALAIIAGLLYIVYAEVAMFRRFDRFGLYALLMALTIAWAVLPRAERFTPPGPLLRAAEQPRLFAEITQTAHLVEQQMPGEVYLVPDVNAWVAQRGGVLGIGGRRVMALGLLLLQAVTVSQLRAVLAHEFGHYYGGDTRLGPFLYQTRGAIARTIQQLGDSLFNLPFRLYAGTFLRLTGAVSRQQEFSADALAARTVGAQALQAGLSKISGASLASAAYLESEVVPVLRAGFVPPLADGFEQFVGAQSINEALSVAMSKQRSEEQADPFDSHPLLRERLAALQSLPAGETPHEDPLAITLLENRAMLERAMLASLLPAGALDRMHPVKWEDVGTVVYLPNWRAHYDKFGKVLARITPSQMPELAKHIEQLRPELKKIDATLEPEDYPRLAMQTLGAGLALLLHARGWAFNAEPGSKITFRHEDMHIEPFDVPGELAENRLDAEVWRQTCAAAGIGDVNLGALEPAPKAVQERTAA